jgi:hypothetical protein
MTFPIALESSAGINPYWVGASALGILLIVLMALLAFGKGREHS